MGLGEDWQREETPSSPQHIKDTMAMWNLPLNLDDMIIYIIGYKKSPQT